MSVDITSETVQLTDGKITLEGTGIAQQVVEIYFGNSTTAITSTTVKADDTWITKQFAPPSGAGTYTVTAKVPSGKREQTESVEVESSTSTITVTTTPSA